MFNLLSQNLKNEIKKEYKIRKLIMVLTFALAIQVSFMVFILPTWLSSFYKEKVMLSDSNKLNQNLSESSVESVSAEILKINQQLNIINNSLNYRGIVVFIDEVLQQKNNTIFIEQFSMSSGNNAEPILFIGGVATTRENLVSFVSRLEQSDLFSEVNLPISNLAKDRNIDFSIEIKIKKR